MRIPHAVRPEQVAGPVHVPAVGLVGSAAVGERDRCVEVHADEGAALHHGNRRPKILTEEPVQAVGQAFRFGRLWHKSLQGSVAFPDFVETQRMHGNTRPERVGLGAHAVDRNPPVRTARGQEQGVLLLVPLRQGQIDTLHEPLARVRVAQ